MDPRILQRRAVIYSSVDKKQGKILTALEQIGHALINQLLLHRPLRSLDPTRSRARRASPFLLPTSGDNRVLLLPQL